MTNINSSVGKRDVEGLIAKGIPPKDAMQIFRSGVGKGIHKSHKPKKRPYIKYEDRDSGEFFH